MTLKKHKGDTQESWREPSGNIKDIRILENLFLGYLPLINPIGSKVKVKGQRSSLEVKGQGYVLLETPTFRH